MPITRAGPRRAIRSDFPSAPYHRHHLGFFFACLIYVGTNLVGRYIEYVSDQHGTHEAAAFLLGQIIPAGVVIRDPLDGLTIAGSFQSGTPARSQNAVALSMFGSLCIPKVNIVWVTLSNHCTAFA